MCLRVSRMWLTLQVSTCRSTRDVRGSHLVCLSLIRSLLSPSQAMLWAMPGEGDWGVGIHDAYHCSRRSRNRHTTMLRPFFVGNQGANLRWGSLLKKTQCIIFYFGVSMLYNVMLFSERIIFHFGLFMNFMLVSQRIGAVSWKSFDRSSPWEQFPSVVSLRQFNNCASKPWTEGSMTF